MLDIKFIREEPKMVKAACRNRGINCDSEIERILFLDLQRKTFILKRDNLRERKNLLTPGQAEEGRAIKAELKELEPELGQSNEELKALISQLPNMPQEEVPVGGESNNKVLRTNGKLPKFNFEPKDHLDLGEGLKVIDVKRAAKVSGSRFAYIEGEFALMEFALIQLAMSEAVKLGFIPVIPPVLIRPGITEKLGYWDRGKSEDYYLVSDSEEQREQGEYQGFYLAGTAEHAVVPMHQDEVFEPGELPKRYVAFSSAFRREAGTYGKDTKGIFRVHQFDKVELVSFVRPEESGKEHQMILSLEEKLWDALKIPYQVVQLAAGDSSLPSASTIDIEAWFPGQGRYREVSSASNTTDFQARRLNIRYKGGDGKPEFVHILNGTGFAIGRTLAAIAENYQTADGSIMIPKVLQKYVGAKKIEANAHGRAEG
ncbi:MAG: serine--tRNA ligase [bacterium]|nr:serine--tRNA ligase [bacterium]MDZ4232128.1 serine--tRNA ligase [Candidatus Pacearchaeota archaeon]